MLPSPGASPSTIWYVKAFPSASEPGITPVIFVGTSSVAAIATSSITGALLLKVSEASERTLTPLPLPLKGPLSSRPNPSTLDLATISEGKYPELSAISPSPAAV